VDCKEAAPDGRFDTRLACEYCNEEYYEDLCPSITDTTFVLQFPHMLIIHAVLDHDVSLEDVALSRRVVAPSVSVVW